MEVSNIAMDINSTIKTCPTHGDYDARVLKIGGKDVITNKCPECAKAAQAEHDAKMDRIIEERRKQSVQETISRSGVPPRYREATISSYIASNEGQQRSLKRTQWYIDTWYERKELGTGMIFAGLPGTGKTHLAAAIANSVIQTGSSVTYVTVSDLTRAIRRTYSDGAAMSESDMIKSYVSPQLLVLDEVGATSGSDHEKQMLFEVINKRYEQVKPTILISNLSGDELKQFLGDRIMDRMRQGGGKLIVFDWESYRK
jgi:DNA replication protein DnaC